ncbi:MAG: fibronectin type III domain-containing protein [Desulfobacterales bacterium]|nr:fibronectin type III domain-containing protein [Desulfobacterales bacterium]
MKHLSRKIFWMAVLAFLGLAIFGCGRKGPPVPPRFEGLKPPVGVRAAMEGDLLVVRWMDPPASDSGLVTGYRIDVSVLNEGEERCEGCPVRFEVLGSVLGHERRFNAAVSKGSLYTLEVRALAEGGYVSDPSRRIEIDLRGKAPLDQKE